MRVYDSEDCIYHMGCVASNYFYSESDLYWIVNSNIIEKLNGFANSSGMTCLQNPEGV